MTCEREAYHRLDLACRLAEEAQQDAQWRRWRSCAANAQQAIEQAAKAVLACFGPVPRTHDAHVNLRQLARTGAMPRAEAERVNQLAAIATPYGRVQHMRVTYGDEDALVSPYDLIGEAEGRRSAADAGQACLLARQIVEARFPPSP